MSNLKYRLLSIAALVALSLIALFPRNIKERVNRDGVFVDTLVRRVPLKFGLDLAGGISMTLVIDQSKSTAAGNLSDQIDQAIKVVRTRIDDEQFGVADPLIQKQGTDRIAIQLPGIENVERAQDLVEKTAFLAFKITDETQALEKNLARIDAAIKEKGLATVGAPGDSGGAKGLNALLGAGGDSAKKNELKVKSDSQRTIDSLLLAGKGPLSSRLERAGMPGEYLVLPTDMDMLRRWFALPEIIQFLPPGKEIVWGADSVPQNGRIYRAFYVVDSKAILTGDFITGAQPGSDPLRGIIVRFTLNSEGGRKFQKGTSEHLHDNMAIILDNRVMGRPPTIDGEIRTEGQITMGPGRSLKEAQDLALVLRAGALPVPLRIEESRVIGASLGRDSISKGMHAGIVAILLVVVIMIGYYRFAGVLAVVGLVFYVLFTLATLAGFGAVLTLPGLAGFILSIGIAVDANVLIFERIREEMAHGKTVRTAIDEGFRHAMSAIIDSNVATALTAAVLYQYGTGPVKGFAVTLLAGIAASMVSAIFVVRTFFLLWLNRSRGAQTLSI